MTQSYKRYVTFLLLVVYIFNQMDRAVFVIVMEPIKREFGLSDTQLGFLSGPALVLFYAALGIPVARWADRSHRINIMSVAIFLWSGIVILTAIAGKFWQLALARVGVGIGEAGFTAVAQSVIADYHSVAERTRAISVFMLALPLGGVVSSLIGGWVNQAYGWRTVFLVAGVPGIVLALLMKCTVREPPRILTSSGGSPPDARPSFALVLTALWTRRALRHLAFAMTLLTLITGTWGSWLATFFIRNHGMSTGELGTWFALTGGVGGAIGVWLSGNLSRWLKIEDERLLVRVLALTAALAWPALIAVMLWPTKTGALLLGFPVSILLGFFFAPSYSLVQSLCTARMRATMLAIVILFQTVAGGIVGVQCVGMLSDAFTASLGADALRWAMIAMTPAALWAAVHFWQAGRYIRDDLDAHTRG